jgi:hypothetical protein
VQEKLEALINVGRVSVTFSSGSSACTAGGTNIMSITFLTELGDREPLLAAQASGTVTFASSSATESTKGNYDLYECSLAGRCQRDTGMCQCFIGQTSSDGNWLSGTRGDCSNRDALKK